MAGNLFAPAVAQLLHELGEPQRGADGSVAHDDDALVFARVTRVVAKPEHRLPNGSYSHYFGFARIERGRRGEVVWFKKDAAIACLYLGPVRLPNDPGAPPAAGDALIGRPVQGAKGAFLAWWAPRAAPLATLRELLRYGTRQKRDSARLYRSLRLDDEGADELYLLARLLLFGDVRVLVDQLRADEGAREPHPSGEKDAGGYARRRGYRLRDTPTEFAFLAAHLCAAPVVFEQYGRALRAAVAAGEVRLDADVELARFDPSRIPVGCAS